MARHVPDDFSFLPTVDSTDEGEVLKDQHWSAKAPPPVEEHEAVEHEHVPEQPAVEEPVYHEESWEEPPHEAPEQPEAHTALQAPQKVRGLEPDVSDHGHEPEPPAEGDGQDGRALWEAYASEHGVDAPTIMMPASPASAQQEKIEPVMPRAALQDTPPVSFGRHETEERFTVVPPVPLHPAPVASESEEPQSHTEDQEPAVHTGLAEDPEAAPADNSSEIKNAKKRAIMMTVGLHAAVALVLLLMHVPLPDLSRPEIVATSTVDELENESWKKVTTAVPQTSAMAASVSPLLSTGVSDIAMPDLDFSASAADLNLGTSFGFFGSGVTTGGAGGKVSFLGNTATAKHVVFVVDVSGSMSMSMNVQGSSMSRFDLLKRELAKSLSALTPGTGYQVIFFSDYAWPHDVVDSNDGAALNKYSWSITSTNRNVTIPRFSYIAANPANIAKSKKIIADANNPGGTNWGSGLLMALKGSPKPDVIFFMTDGDVGSEQGWNNVVTTENSRGKRTIIHTTALGNPDSRKDLAELARRNGGKFTAVMADGKIVRGEDLLK